MVVGQPGEVGDVEGVGREVALGIAEVGAVEPHVRLVHHPVEHDEDALAGAGSVAVEVGAVHHRAGAVGELGDRAPVPGHGDRRPVVVVVVDADAVAPDVVVGAARVPTSDPIHAGMVGGTAQEVSFDDARSGVGARLITSPRTDVGSTT